MAIVLRASVTYFLWILKYDQPLRGRALRRVVENSPKTSPHHHPFVFIVFEWIYVCNIDLFINVFKRHFIWPGTWQKYQGGTRKPRNCPTWKKYFMTKRERKDQDGYVIWNYRMYRHAFVIDFKFMKYVHINILRECMPLGLTVPGSHFTK